MRRFTCLLGMVAIGVLAAGNSGDVNRILQMKAIGRTPLSFQKTDTKSDVWTASGKGYTVNVSGANARVLLNSGKACASVKMRLIGANSAARSEAQQPLPGKVNYLIGRDPKGWRTGIATFGRVEYYDVYKGTDVSWYGNQGQLEYDFSLRPGGDPNRITLGFEGATRLTIAPGGDLRVIVGDRFLTLHTPLVYQEIGGVRKQVSGRYELRASKEVGFRIGAYDKSRTLIIDPYLVYSSYYGSDLAPNSMAVDSNGNVYVGGVTQGGYVPVPGGADTPLSTVGLGSESGVITQFNSSGVVQYSTFIGGSGQDTIQGIAVNPSTGEVFATGATTSTDFPVVSAAQPLYRGYGDAFALKLSADGSTLEYSTYLGGSQIDSGQGIAVDASGSAYITGLTYSSDFLGTQSGSGNGQAFVVKLSASGSISTNFPMFAGDNTEGTGIVADSSGAYITGNTSGTSFSNVSTPGPQSQRGGGQDAFIMRVSATTGSPVWATFLGGSGDENASAIVSDGTYLYVTGWTTSSDLRTVNPLPTNGSSLRGSKNAFVAAVDVNGNHFKFVTYLGGSNYDYAAGLAFDPSSGSLVVAGNTASPDFPTQNALQPAFPSDGSLFYTSGDSGQTWTPSHGLGAAYFLSNITPDPENQGTILATELGTSAKGAGNAAIVQTTNYGQSWQPVYSPVSAFAYSITSLARNPANTSILYAIDSNNAVLKSVNNGASWQKVNSVTSWNNIITVTQNGTVLVFGYDTTNRIFRSTNGGTSFSPATGGFGSATIVQPAYAVVASDGPIFVGTSIGIYESTDDGQTWSLLGGTPAGANNLALAQGTSSTLYTADCTSVYSRVSGGTWTPLSGSAGDGICYVAGSPSTPNIFGATQNGDVFVSTDGGTTWTVTGAGVDNTAITGLVVDPTSPNGNSYVYLTSKNTGQSGFITSMATDASALSWSTYFGDSSQGFSLNAVASHSPEGVWIAGSGSLNLPLSNNAALTSGLDGSSSFIAQLSNATPSCSYSINPTSQYVYATGTVYLSVTAPSGCAWTASTDSPAWIGFKTGGSGTGSGTVVARVQGNPTDPSRIGNIFIQAPAPNTVATFTITEPAATCTYSVTNVPAAPQAGGSVTLTMTASSPAGAQCQYNELPLSGYSSVHDNLNGTFTVTVPPNQSINSQPFVIQAGGQLVTINQASVCQYSGFPNGQTLPVSGLAGGGSLSGISVTPSVCSLNATSDAQWLTVTNSAGNGAISYSYTGNYTTGPRYAHIMLNGQEYTITQAAASALQFVPLQKTCRFVDTRGPASLYTPGVFGTPSLQAQTSRSFPLASITNPDCGQIPSNAVAFSLNITVVPHGGLGYLTVWPSDRPQPNVSTLNSDGRVKANAAIVAASSDGTQSISFYATQEADLVLDLNGYFVPAGTNSAGLDFYPLTPCRIADTRSRYASSGPPSLSGGASAREFFVATTSSCMASLPAGVQPKAYSLNFTAVPVPNSAGLSYLSVWPGGEPEPDPPVSTLNAALADSPLSAPVTANAAIVPAGNGGVEVFAAQDTDLVIDIDGYFAAPGPGGLSFYPATPCRVLDSRQPPGAQPLIGTVLVNVVGSQCAPPSTAQAYVMNATVVPVTALSYLTLWSDSGPQPNVSTLNAQDYTITSNSAIVPTVTSNMAIVPTTYGNINTFFTNPTALVLDYLGFFAP